MAKDISSSSSAPHYASIAWSMERTNTKNTKGLSVQKILQAALSIADQKGAAAVTIRTVAQQTGFSTMAIYRHVESRDELMLLLIETALGEALYIEPTTWQNDIRTWADNLSARYGQHPWVLDLPLIGIPSMPNHISWVEQILRILAPTNLPLQTRLDAALLVDNHVRQFATISAIQKKQKNSTDNIQWLQDLAADKAPTLMLALQQGAMQSKKGPNFSVGLNIIIQGIAASIKQ